MNDPQMYVAYNRVLEFSNDEALPAATRRAFKKAAHLIFGEKPVDALKHLCEMRVLLTLWKGAVEPFVETSDLLASLLISSAKSLQEVSVIRDAIGPWVKTPILFVLLVARESGLTALHEMRG